MDEVTIEHRLTRIEEQQSAGFSRLDARLVASASEIEGIKLELRRMNGSVREHGVRIASLEDRPQMGVTSTSEAQMIIGQHREVWQWFAFGRWVLGAWMLALLGLNAFDFARIFLH